MRINPLISQRALGGGARELLVVVVEVEVVLEEENTNRYSAREK